MKIRNISYSLILTLIINVSGFAQIATLERTLEIKKVNGVSVPYQNGIPLTSFEKQNRKMQDLSGIWKKERTSADDNITLAKRDENGLANLANESEGRYLSDYDDSSWEDKQIPSVENQMNEYPTVPEFFKNGVWYRRSFNVDAEDSGKFAKLVFITVNYIADVWINGEYVGYHEGGYTPFAFDISSFIKYGEENTIAVRVDLITWGAREDVIPHKQVDWFNYGGILQDVYIEFSNKISAVRSDVVPINTEGNIKIKTVIQNNNNIDKSITAFYQIFEAKVETYNIASEYSYELIGDEISWSGEDQTNLAVPADSVLVHETDIFINNPNLWSPHNPNLYILKVSLLDENSNIYDEYYTQFGIRTVSTLDNKFLLNNRIMFLTGTARHEDHPLYGRSLPKEIIFSDLNLIKSLNVNFLRTAHYPNHPYTYLILDRLGITAMEEIPLWQVDSENPWIIQNNNRKMHLQMFREMVYKDFNRPSLILWSTSNECHDTATNMVNHRIFYNQMISEDHSENYEDGRLISQSPAADNPGPNDQTQNYVDVAGWTMYFGIFHGSTYFGGTYFFLNDVKNNFPNKPILDTEFGYWSSENNSTLDDQVTVAEETFKAFKLFAALNIDGTVNKNGSLMACTWWCAFDWYTAGIPRGYQSMGLYSMDRQTEKPVAAKIRNLYLPFFLKDGVLTTIDENVNNPNIIRTFELKQNYPNPFNPSTTIEYYLPEQSEVKISLFDILGREVSMLTKGSFEKGVHTLNIDTENLNNSDYILTSGVYFCKMTAKSENFSEFSKSIKILLLK